MNKLVKYVLKFIVLLCSLNCIQCRVLWAEVNPNYTDHHNYTNAFNLVYIQSKGDKDVVHYLWSSITCIPPTLLIVETDLNAKLDINWNPLLRNNCSEYESKDLANAIRFTNGSVANSMGIQFSRLLLFNDVNKKGSYDENDHTFEVNWDTLIWNQEKTPKTGDSVKLSLKNSNVSTQSLLNGSIAFDLRVDNSDGRSDVLPHLAFTQKSLSLQISANNFQTDKYFNETNKPRLMAEVFVMTGGNISKTVPEFDSITSIDDEFTPGVFRRMVLDLKTDKEPKNSFLSWKPIAYNSDERIIANTLDVIQGSVKTLNSSQLVDYKSLIFEAFFDIEYNPKYSFDLTFGAPDDETYYDDKKYNSFSLVVGVDSAPDEELSFLVKIIIVVGFGLPLLVMVVSALYLIVRKIRKRNFNGLLLNQSQQSLDDPRE